jgi:hypothetical protein
MIPSPLRGSATAFQRIAARGDGRSTHRHTVAPAEPFSGHQLGPCGRVGRRRRASSSGLDPAHQPNRRNLLPGKVEAKAETFGVAAMLSRRIGILREIGAICVTR